MLFGLATGLGLLGFLEFLFFFLILGCGRRQVLTDDLLRGRGSLREKCGGPVQLNDGRLTRLFQGDGILIIDVTDIEDTRTVDDRGLTGVPVHVSVQFAAPDSDLGSRGGNGRMRVDPGARQAANRTTLVTETTCQDRCLETAQIGDLIKLKVIQRCLCIPAQLESCAVIHLRNEKAAGPTGLNPVAQLQLEAASNGDGLVIPDDGDRKRGLDHPDGLTCTGRRSRAGEHLIAIEDPVEEACHHLGRQARTTCQHQIGWRMKRKVVINDEHLSAAVGDDQVKSDLLEVSKREERGIRQQHHRVCS